MDVKRFGTGRHHHGRPDPGPHVQEGDFDVDEPFKNGKVTFEGKEGKIAKTEKKRTTNGKKRKGFEKKLLLTISKVNFEGKGGKIAKMEKNRKKRKGFEKKLLLTISKVNFEGKGGKIAKMKKKGKKAKRV